MNRRRNVAAVTATAIVAVAVGCTPARDLSHPGPSTTPASTNARPDAGLSTPVADPIYPAYGNPSLDVLRYQLTLGWSPERRELAGTATLTIRATRAVTEIALDFSDAYTVDSATVDGVPATAGRRDNDLVVPATLAKDARTTLAVTYRGTPVPVPMPSKRTDFPAGLGLRITAAGEVWTMQEPYGALTWYPVNDQPSDEAVYDVAVTVPKGWAAVTHGEFLGVDAGGVGDTYRWRAADPVASYLATLAVGRYTKITDTGPRGLPITYWTRTGKDEPMEPALRKTPELLAWLEQRFGPYPFPTAGVVVVESRSAMETQQMVTFGALIGRPRGEALDLELVEEVLLHELAHQWFGDAVTPKDWRGMWLNEGFAMYAQWLWSVDQGLNTDAGWSSWARNADARSRAVAGPPGNPLPDHFGETNVYAGPAYVLHKIHETVGDDAFFAMARDWVQTQRNQQVDRDGFVAFVNRHTGHDFTELINRWLDSATTPT